MKRFDEMNVIPLIDVMLVLLAIVLVTASFVQQDSLKIELPDTDNTSAYEPTKEKTINIAINAKGELFIDEKPTLFTALDEIILLQKFNNETPIIVKVDDKARFGAFIKLVDILKAHNLTNLTFLTEKTK